MPVTLIVEPDPGGHRFQAVGNVARAAIAAGSPVVLLTSTIGRDDVAFGVFLADLDIEVEAPFDAIYPRTADMVRAVRDVCDDLDVARVIVMDADQSLKRWWYLAPRAFRGLRRRPKVTFMVTRYPARLSILDRTGWRLRIPKATLALFAMATGSLHRVVGFAGRDDLSRGWVVRRVRDPETCLAHSRDRDAIRDELGLPRDRKLVGLFGVIQPRKNAPLILEALKRANVDADLLLGGELSPEVRYWVDGLPEEDRRRVIVRDAFLTDLELDQLVAAVDVAPIALTNNGPSGIMGKAIAAGVPVVTAGSRVRAREVVALDVGQAVDLDAASIGIGIRDALARGTGTQRHSAIPLATPEEFGHALLGMDAQHAAR